MNEFARLHPRAVAREVAGQPRFHVFAKLVLRVDREGSRPSGAQETVLEADLAAAFAAAGAGPVMESDDRSVRLTLEGNALRAQGATWAREKTIALPLSGARAVLIARSGAWLEVPLVLRRCLFRPASERLEILLTAVAAVRPEEVRELRAEYFPRTSTSSPIVTTEDVDVRRIWNEAKAPFRLQEAGLPKENAFTSDTWRERASGAPSPQLEDPDNETMELRYASRELDSAQAVTPPIAAPAQPPHPIATSISAPLHLEIQRRLETSARFDGLVLRNVDLRGLSFVGADLGGLDFTEANLSGVDLSRARLEGTTFHRSLLNGAKLDDARLTDAIFTETQAVGASFKVAIGTRVRFARSRLERSDFERAVLDGADFSGCSLNQALFKSAGLSDARFTRAQGAGLTFHEARLTRASFDGAELHESSFDAVQAEQSTWDKAKLDGSTFRGAQLDSASFVKAACLGGVFNHATLRRARLQGARLMKASFDEAEMTFADLRLARCDAASFVGAKMRSLNATGRASRRQRSMTQISRRPICARASASVPTFEEPSSTAQTSATAI